MNNYSNALKYSEVAANSAGSALERYGVYQDSIEAKTNQLTAAIESLSMNTVSEELYSGIIQATTGLVEFLDKTNLLKGALSGLVAMGVSKAFVSISTGIISAVKSTTQLSAAMALFDKGRSIANLKSIGAACKGLSNQQLKLVLSTKGLRTQQRLAILEGMGLEEQERQQTLATLGLASAENTATAATFSLKGAFTALKTVIATNPLGVIFTAVTTLTMLFSWLKQKQEEAAQALQDAISEYDSAKSSLESINSELEEQNKKMDELLSKDKLTYAEKGQLEELQAITQELLLQQDIEQRRADKASKEVAEKTVDAYNKQYGKYDVSREKLNETLDYTKSTGISPIAESENDIIGNIAAYLNVTEGLKKAQQEYEAALNSGEDTEFLIEDVQDYIDAVDDYSDVLNQNISDLQEKRLALEDEYNKAVAKRNNGEDLTSYDTDAISTYESIYEAIRLIYEYIDPNKWNNMEISSIFNTEGIEKTKEELISMYKSGELASSDMLEQFPKLNQAIRESEIIAGEGSDAFKEFFNEIAAMADETTDAVGTTTANLSFSIDTYKDQIDDIQSSISTLRSALDSFNSGTLDTSAVIDLMQQFPALVPYVDLAADGFGNLSEGLSTLIAQQPDSLIQSLESLKDSLNTDEECAQVDALINSLQALSSYGDTGMEAYATSIGSTWTDTANVIESVTTQFENLAKVQEAVANGLTMSTTAAAELAKMYPEILTNAEYAGNGQITLNEEVVKSILAGDQAIINAQITKLEADKAELEARKETAIAELEIANQVGTAKGQIDEETARNKIALLNQELENEISKNNQVGQSYAKTAEGMALNTEQLGNYEADVADNMATNMNTASSSMADGMATNSEASQISLSGIAQKATDVALAIAGIPTGNTIKNPSAIYAGRGGTNKGGIKKVASPGRFTSTVNDFVKGELSLDEFKSNIEVDISSYEKAISNIDSQIDVLKNLQATFNDTVNSANGGIGGHNYANKIKDLEKEKDKINNALKDKKDSSKKEKDEYKEVFDFFDHRTNVLDNALSILKANLDNVTGSFAKNNLIDAELGITEEKFKNYSDALNMYTQKANDALSKLPADIAAKVKDGAVDLTTFVGDGNKEVVEAIKDYEQWADKVSDCKQELAELRTAIRQLELEKFNNIMEDFTNQFDLHEDGKELISKQVDLLKEAGQLIGESFFTTQIDQSKKQLALLEDEKVQLVNQMSSAIGSGRVQKGTDEWLEMVNALSDVEGNILDCKKAIEEFDNELLQLHWDIFDRIQDQFKDFDSELSNLRGLFDDFKVTDGKSTWSKEGLAQLGLLTQQYELAQYQVQQYNDELNKLNSDYLAGRYSATEYADRLSDLSSAQWDAVNSSESIKDAIIDLNEVRINEEIEAIEKEIEAYRKLIDAQIEALRAAKDLHDYQQMIAEKTKSVTDLERQIAAMQNDDTAATVAKRKQLEEQLAQARKELEDAEYDHSIEAQENALNKQLEDYEAQRNAEIEALRASLEEREALIAQSFETVKANAGIIGQEIAQIAVEHGITVSDALITSWQNGENAIASYGQVLSAGTSAFIGNIMGVENEVYALQAQANATADTLAYMFATRADNLVNELTSSYYSEANLNAMTNALQDSLINTLERGYNIGSITSALDSIAAGADNVASAANNAANALSRMGAAQSSAQAQSKYASQSSATASSASKTSGGGRNTIYDEDSNIIAIVSDQRLEEMRKSGQVIGNTKFYAKGTRNAKGGLRVVNEKGVELTLPKLSSGNYAIGNDGDQILTKDETDNVYEWAQIEPDKLWAQIVDRNPAFCEQAINPSISNNSKAMPEIKSGNTNNSINVHYDSLVNIQGDVHDANRIVKQMENVAEKAIKKSWHDFDMTRKYGIY